MNTVSKYCFWFAFWRLWLFRLVWVILMFGDLLWFRYFVVLLVCLAWWFGFLSFWLFDFGFVDFDVFAGVC